MSKSEYFVRNVKYPEAFLFCNRKALKPLQCLAKAQIV